MNRLAIELKTETEENRKDSEPDYTPYFKPGETIQGQVVWVLEKNPKQVFLRLFWYTKGKGTEDIEVIDEITFDSPLQQEHRPFEISLPQSPYSFSGQLVSLIWALELVTDSPDEAIQKEIVLSPYGHEIDLSKQKQDK